MCVKDMLALLEEVAPAHLAEDWDNSGLMIGRAGDPIKKVPLALDPTPPQTIRAACRAEAQLLLTHHPLIFKPLKKLDLDEFTAASVAEALKSGVAVVSAHTNLDAADQGVSWSLAKKLNLVDIESLERRPEGRTFKIAVFVPLGYEGQIRRAVFEAGAGRIGEYSACSFASRGIGNIFARYAEPPANIGRGGQERTG